MRSTTQIKEPMLAASVALGDLTHWDPLLSLSSAHAGMDDAEYEELVYQSQLQQELQRSTWLGLQDADPETYGGEQSFKAVVGEERIA